MTLESYIRVYPDIVSPELCRATIDAFEKDTDNHELSGHRDDKGEMIKVDATCIRISRAAGWEEIDGEFFKHVGNLWDMYKEEFNVLTNIDDPIEDESYEVHRYDKGKGSQKQHYDSGQSNMCRRIVTFLMYLNDVEKGGRTIFEDWGINVVPKQGSVLVFPSAFTHMHEGEMPISNDKYMLRTWMQFQ